MRRVVIDEKAFATSDEVHAHIASELGLPAYYGVNLDALNDCLGDICEPTTLIVDRTNANEGEFNDWFDRFCRVLVRNALENDFLDVKLLGRS